MTPNIGTHGLATPATTSKPPTYDERQDEVNSIASVVSGSAQKPKRDQNTAHEIVSTAGDEAGQGMSTRLPSILSNNHGNSVPTYLTSVDGFPGSQANNKWNENQVINHAPSISQLQ
jgi:hypothetical protein